MRRFISVFVMLSAAAWLSACSREAPDQVAPMEQEVPDEVFTDFVTQESDSGQAKWRLKAPRANRFSDKKLVLLDRPVIEFFDDEGKTQTTLISDAGEYSEKTGDMLAFGNVRVESVKGDILETDSLIWKNKEDKIVSQSFVKLTRGRDVITGIGLECDPELNSVDIKKDVKATITDQVEEIEP